MTMIVAFLESIKYVGHLFPVAFLRVYLGYYYLNEALARYSGTFVQDPILAERAKQGIQAGGIPDWYQGFLTNVVIAHWQTAAYVIVGVQFFVGVSYLLGYLVRPASFFAVIVGLHFVTVSVVPSEILLSKTFVVTHLMLAWLGAGRCLGLDYYFYKRNRGIWW